MTLMKSHIPVY